MPQQLIYTSAPQGVASGRSGHCTVARSAAMREPLVLRLEQLSYYQHLSLSGGKERPICAYRIIDIRGSRFHVLSRIQDAGLDFTGRTNFIAHHLAFTPEEFRQFATPPVILRDWTGWEKSWTREPTLFENEDWTALASLGSKSSVPAQTWHHVTGDSVNGYGLLEARAGATFRVDDQTNETILGLFAESIELLEVRDARRDFRAAALPYTFTTSMQEQDNPADFRWRCIHSDNPAANRLATPDCRPLSAVRATKWTGEETAFARTGRQAPRFILEPQDVQITEGTAARFQAKAEGIPNPTYQWFSVDRANTSQQVTGEIRQELVPSNPPLGVSRYVVRASNGSGDITSRTATLSVERKPAIVRPKADGPPRLRVEKSEQEKRKEWQEFQAQETRNTGRKGRGLGWVVGGIALALVIITIFAIVYSIWKSSNSLSSRGATSPTSRDEKPSQPQAHVPGTSEANPPSQANAIGNETENTDPNSTTKPGVGMPPQTEYPLPTGWTSLPIGNVPNKKAEYFPKHNRFDLEAMASGFASNSDSVLFVCSTNDEGEFRVQLKKWPADGNTAGIMMRQSLDSHSPFLFIGASGNQIVSYSRDTESKYRDRSTNSLAEKQLPLNLWFNVGANGFVTARCSGVGNIPGDAKTEWKLPSKALVGFAVFSPGKNRKATQFFYEPATNRPMASRPK